jgi:hypothetical protein
LLFAALGRLRDITPPTLLTRSLFFIDFGFLGGISITVLSLLPVKIARNRSYVLRLSKEIEGNLA